MLSKIYSCTLLGLDVQSVIIETDFSQGLPGMRVVGLPDTMVREACDRIKPAIVNSGYQFPLRKITVNLSPANLRKEGSHFDLPIAMGILSSAGMIKINDDGDCAFLGELSLDGKIQRIEGALPMVIGLAENGIKHIFLPKNNQEEASLVLGVNIYPVETLKEVVEHFSTCKGKKKLEPYTKEKRKINVTYNKGSFCLDYSDVKGQEKIKRAIVISCSGNHGLLMRGEPGSGKTMIAKRIPTVMPELTYEECLEVTKIYSIAGKLSKEQPFIGERPFRAPHHTITATALIGGGGKPKLGELSLAHKGVLFLDELPEFNRNVLENLRQPLEEKHINISRLMGNFCFPCDFLLVAAANPCPCGFYGSQEHECTCSVNKIEHYRNKISGPLLDRFDLQVEVLPVKYEDIADSTGNLEMRMCKDRYMMDDVISSEHMRKQVEKVRKIQEERYKDERISFNSQLEGDLLQKYCFLDDACSQLMENAFKNLGLSARGYVKVLKVARTIADLEESLNIRVSHIAEALSYRMQGYRGV